MQVLLPGKSVALHPFDLSAHESHEARAEPERHETVPVKDWLQESELTIVIPRSMVASPFHRELNPE
jgi:hypothetical protein